MVQILERLPSKGEKFMESFHRAAPSFAQAFSSNMQQKQELDENESIERLTGQNLSGLSPDLKKLFLNQMSKGTQGDESLNRASTALDELEQMVGNKGIGLLGQFNPSGESRHNRGKFESMGAAVMPIFKSMFPRGMTEKEFAFVNKHYIPQSSDSEQTIKGKIAGLRQLMSNPNAAPQMIQQQMQNGGDQKAFGSSKMLRLRDPETGQIYPVSTEKAQQYISQGAELVE